MRAASLCRTIVAACLLAGTTGAAAPLAAGGLDAASPAEVTVYAAASLRDALQRLAPACEKALGVHLVFNFGASSELARQIEAANKADLFFSADEDWMERLDRAGRVDPGTRRALLSNRLVVVGPIDGRLRVTSAADLAAPAVRRLSLANPEAVPAGKYAKVWLEKAGRWEAVKDRVVPALDVRAALAAVESGAVELGVVYRTDAAISKKVRVLYEVPESEGPCISYALAALRGRPLVTTAREVASWLSGAGPAAVFEEFGFIVTRPAS